MDLETQQYTGAQLVVSNRSGERLRSSGPRTLVIIYLIPFQVALLQCSSAIAGAIKVCISYTSCVFHLF